MIIKAKADVAACNRLMGMTDRGWPTKSIARTA
jgi:hypothetical protein